jgi:hypothetical protein
LAGSTPIGLESRLRIFTDAIRLPWAFTTSRCPFQPDMKPQRMRHMTAKRRIDVFPPFFGARRLTLD